MALFQLLGCEINVGGDRDNTVVRDQFDPVTYPEFLILQAIHGGVDHVHDAVVVGEAELDPAAERERLALKYGAELAMGLFPGALAMLPLGDVSFPTLAEVQAGTKAATEARAAVRAKVKTTKPKEPQPEPEDEPAPTKPVLPDLTSK